jgi:hypothetical protein
MENKGFPPKTLQIGYRGYSTRRNAFQLRINDEKRGHAIVEKESNMQRLLPWNTSQRALGCFPAPKKEERKNVCSSDDPR